MGNAKFMFYPEPHGAVTHLVEIDIGEAVGEMYSDMIVDAVDGISLTGQISRNVGRMTEIVTIQRDRMILGEDLAHQFAALQNHLDRGYSVAFTADSDKSYIYPLRGNHAAGSFTLRCYRNPFLSMLGSTPYPSNGEYLTVETSSPAIIKEDVKVEDNSSITANGGQFDITRRLNFYYSRPAFARWHRFYPVLKRPQEDLGSSIITNEGGRLFSLNIRLVVDYATLFAFHPDTVSEDGVSGGRGLVGPSSAAGTAPTGYGRDSTLDGFGRNIGNQLRDNAESGTLANTNTQPPDFIWD